MAAGKRLRQRNSRQHRRARRFERKSQVETLEMRSLLASFTTLEDTPLVIDVPTGQQAVVVTPPKAGNVERNNAGDLIYRPLANYHGSDSFAYRIGNDTTARETASITITPVNDPPQIHYPNLTWEVQQGVAYSSPAPGVLAYVTSVDGEPLRASLVEGPAHGMLTLNADGSFIYQSAADFFGADHFVFRASEGTAATDSATGRMTLAVKPNNELPRANPDWYSTPQDTALRVEAPGVLANDNTRLSVSVARQPAHGTVSLNADGSFVYTPAAGYNGVDTFVYRLNDPAAAGYSWNQTTPTAADTPALGIVRPPLEATVTIRVGTIVERPHAVNDSYAVQQGTELNVPAPGVLANDQGRSNTSRLTAALVRGPEHGTLTLNADGSFVYKPNAGFNGIDVFRYRALDSATNVPEPANPDFHISVATVSLYVTADSPPIAQPDNYAAEQNKPLTVAAPGVLGNDIGSGKPLAATLLTQPEHGTLVFKADGSFIYMPAKDFYGVDTFRYQARDANATTPATNSGFAPSGIATVSIYVRPAKLPLIVNDDYYVAKQNTVLEVAAPGVLGNDYILDVRPPQPFTGVITGVYIPPPTLSATLLTGPTHGTLTLNQDGSFKYTPNADFVGKDTFTYRARWENGQDDPVFTGVGTATISVHPASRLPVAHDDSYVGLQDTPLEVAAPGVLGNDERPAGVTVAPVVATPPSRGTLTLNPNGSFKYVPNEGFSGHDYFTYRLQQPTTTASSALESNTAGVWLYIRPNNPIVRAEDDHYSTPAGTPLKVEAPGVLKNDVAIPILLPVAGGLTNIFYPNPVGPLPTKLMASLVRGPQFGTLSLNADGSFVYTPQGDFAGIDTFTYKASASPLTGGGVLVLADSALGGESGQPPEILPHDIATVTINVVPPNQGAVVARDNEYKLRQDTTLTVAPPGVLGNDFSLSLDPAASSNSASPLPLTAELVKGPEHGTLTLRPDGGFTYAPAAGFVGIDRFTYKAVSGTHSDEAVVALFVYRLRPPPRFVVGPHQNVTDESGAQAIPGWTTPQPGDPANAAESRFVFNVTSDNAGLFKTPPAIDASGRLTYTPAPNASGTARVTVVLRDEGVPAAEGESASEPQTFTITVAKPNLRYNTERPLDVSGDDAVSPIDAVLVINYLNAFPGRELPASAVASSDFLDTNRDNAISAIDAVLVINYLNALRPGATASAETGGTIVYNMTYVEPQIIMLGEGEADPLAEALLLIAGDAAEEAARKRRRT